MSENDNTTSHTPAYFLIIIIIAALPTFVQIPAVVKVLGDYMDGMSAVSGWLYPVYVVLSGICAYVCYPGRRALAWILVGLMVLSAIFLFILQMTWN